MAEYIIAVDEFDKEIEPIEKMEAHHKGAHIVVKNILKYVQR